VFQGAGGLVQILAAIGPSRRSLHNVPQNPLRVLLGARQVAPGLEKLALPVLNGVQSILEQSSLSGKGYDRRLRSVSAGERHRRIESTTLHRHSAFASTLKPS
jgi:hypothetical protein